MEIFIIALVLVILTWYSVRMHFDRKKKSTIRVAKNPLRIDKDLFLTGIENIVIRNVFIQKIESFITSEIYGSTSYARVIIASFLAQGHVIIQGPPGTGKTSIVKSFSRACDLTYGRIQCTPDLLPQDILGNEILQKDSTELVYKKGPIFSQVVHVDEINRTTPKLQSAFLEAMQESQITMYGKKYELPKPFFLVATQNPYDAIGTYILPYAQIDRFMVGISTGNLSVEDEIDLIKNDNAGSEQNPDTRGMIGMDGILLVQQEIQKSVMPEVVLEYCVACIQQLKQQGFELSIRATKSLVAIAKAIAYMQGRTEVEKEDVVVALLPTIRHRVTHLVGKYISAEQIYEIMIGSLQKDDIVM